jgi:hypothetical protein
MVSVTLNPLHPSHMPTRHVFRGVPGQVSDFRVDFVAKPKLGYEDPAEVRAEVEFSLHRVAHQIKGEWDQLREHDVVFLLQVTEATPARRSAVGVPPAKHGGGGGGGGGAGAPHRRGGDRDRDAKDRGREVREEQLQQEAKAMVVSIRGAEVVQVLDEARRVLNDPSAEPSERDKPPVGNKRTLRLLLDPSQYQRDVEAGNLGVYDKFNVVVSDGLVAPERPPGGPRPRESAPAPGCASPWHLRALRMASDSSFSPLPGCVCTCPALCVCVCARALRPGQMRRNSKENNFKAILETIRDVMNVAAIGNAVPGWLHDVFLGYGDAAAAHYKNLPSQLRSLDMVDTFVSGAHAASCFPGQEVVFRAEDGSAIPDAAVAGLAPPFRAAFEPIPGAGGKARERVVVTPYRPLSMGPYPEDVPKRNPVPFTPVQTEAIRAGCNPGLTMVVGPPGTGKTDVAVQIISNLYHNFPNQRTLLVTHSNHVRGPSCTPAPLPPPHHVLTF